MSIPCLNNNNNNNAIFKIFDFATIPNHKRKSSATTLPQIINQNSQRLARYEPRKRVTFCRNCTEATNLWGPYKSAWILAKLGDTAFLFWTFITEWL